MSVQLNLWENASLGSSVPADRADAQPVEPPLPSAARQRDSVNLLSTLQKQIQQIETARRPKLQAISSGIPPLDALLPCSGFPPGSLVEWITQSPACCGGWLALLGACKAHEQSGGKVVILDYEQTFYPPAATVCGLPTDAIILLRPQPGGDALWALDQSLRSPAVAAVWGHLPRLDDCDARRLQLAAESGGTLGVLTRPPGAINQPSWAEVRLLAESVTPRDLGDTSRRVSVRLLRVRDGRPGGRLLLEIDQTSGIVRRELQRGTTSTQRLAAELARPAVSRRQQARRA